VPIFRAAKRANRSALPQLSAVASPNRIPMTID
jgi:hypothetical protein